MPQEVATDLERQLALALRELSEARDQQAATSDVLRIISSSPGELNPVFQAILAKSRYDIFAVRALFALLPAFSSGHPIKY